MLPILMLVAALAAPQASPPALHGTWNASVGARQAFHGTWSADLLPDTPNTATGSWTLLGEGNQIVAEGTWSAVKAAGSWSGRWSARILPPAQSRTPSSTGRVTSGTWQADIAAGSRSKTLGEMLQSTLQTQITGAWRSSGLQGRWWLEAA
jgi:hypothetical protein